VHNGGTDPVTGAVAHVTPVTPGVTMLDDTAWVGNLAPGATVNTQGPNLIARLGTALTCGQMVSFDINITAAQGSWPATFQQQVGQVIAARSGIVLNEGFASGVVPPAGWTVIDGSMDGNPDGFKWFADSVADPSGCGSTNPAIPPFAGSWAAVDSSCTGGGDRMDEQLITPVLNLTTDPVVTLAFDHWFAAEATEVADVDVRSSATGGQWVNVRRFTGASSPNAQHVVIDISAQAGNASNVQIRWHYYNAQQRLYWYVDNVVVDFFAPEICNMTTCAASASSPPPIPATMTAERMTLDGSQIAVTWNNSCSAASAKILYGPLSQVSSHAISGAVCGISAPASWTAVPPGDLWFVVVSGNASGVEGSWGSSSSGERNGLTDSGTCGATTKDLTGTCP
jgi:hypothetical protein